MLDAAGVGAFRGSEIILVFFSAVAIVPVRRTHRSEDGRHHALGDNKDVGTIFVFLLNNIVPGVHVSGRGTSEDVGT